MVFLPKFGLKVFTKSDKHRDKTLRHSRSMPLRNSAETDPETYTHRSRPVYRGKHPLKTSDIQVVLDIKGPGAAIWAFNDNDEGNDPDRYETGNPAPPLPPPKPSRREVIDQFPSPPKDMPVPPLRPFKPIRPLDEPDANDYLPPPPDALLRLRAMRAQMDKESYRPPVTKPLQRSSSVNSPARPTLAAYRDPVQPHAVASSSVLDGEYYSRKARPSPASQKIMSHANYSTKSLGANMSLGPNARIKQGPVAHAVVIQNPTISHAIPLQPRPRMQSNTSARSTTDGNVTTSLRRQPRVDEYYHKKRLESNPKNVPHQASEMGYREQQAEAPHHHHHRRDYSTTSRAVNEYYRA